MLIAADGEYAGLLSGGCLESDLREHARTVILSGEPRAVHYDLRTPDELLWGLGLGCEGAMDILLLRAGPENDWQPLAHLAGALAAHTATAIGFVTESARADLPVGTLALPSGAVCLERRRCRPRWRAAPLTGRSVGSKDTARPGSCAWCRWRCRRGSCCSAPARTQR